MTWVQGYQLKRTFRRSLWLMPVLAIGLVLVVAPSSAGSIVLRAGPGSTSLRRAHGRFWERSRHRC